jgi:hypothetical protein
MMAEAKADFSYGKRQVDPFVESSTSRRHLELHSLDRISMGGNALSHPAFI